MLLSVTIEYLSRDEIKTLYDRIHDMMVVSLESGQESLVELAITSIMNLATSTQNLKVLKKFQELLPLILQSMDGNNEDILGKLFDTFIELVDLKGLLDPYFEDLLKGALEIAQNEEMQQDLRMKCLFFIEMAPMHHSKIFKKSLPLLEGVIEALFQISIKFANTDDESAQGDSDNSIQAIKGLGKCLKNKVIWPVVWKQLDKCFQTNDPIPMSIAIKVIGEMAEQDVCMDAVVDQLE